MHKAWLAKMQADTTIENYSLFNLFLTCLFGDISENMQSIFIS